MLAKLADRASWIFKIVFQKAHGRDKVIISQTALLPFASRIVNQHLVKGLVEQGFRQHVAGQGLTNVQGVKKLAQALVKAGILDLSQVELVCQLGILQDLANLHAGHANPEIAPRIVKVSLVKAGHPLGQNKEVARLQADWGLSRRGKGPPAA